MKVSGQFRNDAGKGADQYAIIRSVTDTLIKNRQDVYEAFLSLAKKHKIASCVVTKFFFLIFIR